MRFGFPGVLNDDFAKKPPGFPVDFSFGDVRAHVPFKGMQLRPNAKHIVVIFVICQLVGQVGILLASNKTNTDEHPLGGLCVKVIK